MMSNSKKQTRGTIGFGWLLAGLVFLSNPYFNLVDILPDAIGYGMLLIGLGELVFAVPSFEDAIKTVKVLFSLSLIRGVAFFLVASLPQKESPTMSLLAIFCLVLIEGYFAWRLIREFFDGLTYLCRLPASDEMEKRLQRLKRFTRIVLIFKLMGNLIPELAVLGVSEEGYIFSVTENMSQVWLQFRNVLAVFFFLVVLIVALIFIAKWKRLLNAVKKNKEFRIALALMIKDNPEPKRKRVVRLSQNAFALFSIGCICLWSAQIDGYVFMPIFLGGLFIGLGCLSLDELLSGMKKDGWAWMLGATALGALLMISTNLFYARQYAIGSARGAQNHMTLNLILAAVYGCFICLMLIRIGRRMQQLVSSHCFEEIPADLVRTAMETENQKHRLKRRIGMLMITSIPIALLEMIERATVFTEDPTFSLFKTRQTISLWGIFTLLRLGWIIFAIATFTELARRVKEKYNENG